MNPVVHFEMPYNDRSRMARFYEQAFGWRTEALGKEMANYVLATTTETDDGRPKQPGAINGGFYERKADWPASSRSPFASCKVPTYMVAGLSATFAGK